MKKTASISILLGTLLLLLTGCATHRNKLASEHTDHFEVYNQNVHQFNSDLHHYAIRPVGEVVEFILPDFVEHSIASVYENLSVPNTALNNLAQGKPKSAGHDLMRFGINTTLGIGGIFDWASMWGIPKNEEDFGQTLATYGVAHGPYIVLPVLGGITPRGLSGMIINADPTSLLDGDNLLISQSVSGLAGFAEVADIKELPSYEENRDLYYAFRHCSVLDGHQDAAANCALACEAFSDMISQELEAIGDPVTRAHMAEEMQPFIPSYCNTLS